MEEGEVGKEAVSKEVGGRVGEGVPVADRQVIREGASVAVG